jgi:hypothetical protein
MLWETNSYGEAGTPHMFQFRKKYSKSFDPASLEPGTVFTKDVQITMSPLNVNTYEL